MLAHLTLLYSCCEVVMFPLTIRTKAKFNCHSLSVSVSVSLSLLSPLAPSHTGTPRHTPRISNPFTDINLGNSQPIQDSTARPSSPRRGSASINSPHIQLIIVSLLMLCLPALLTLWIIILLTCAIKVCMYIIICIFFFFFFMFCTVPPPQDPSF